MSKFLYPIFKLPNEYKQDLDVQEVPLYIKWWLYNHYKKSHSWIISEIITGNPLTLNDSVQAKFPKPPLPRGNSEQVQLTGSNKFNKNTTIVGSYNCTYTFNDGVYTITNTNTQSNFSFTLNLDLSAGSYTLNSTKATSDSTILYNSQNEMLVNLSNNHNYYNFSIAENSTSIRFNFLATSQPVTLDLNSLQIVSGTYTSSTMPAYEPYVGGTASPNPSYPQEITNVTGDVEVLVQNKNKLSSTAEFSTTSNGMNFTGDGKGTYKMFGTSTANTAIVTNNLQKAYTIKSGDYLHLKNNATGSISVIFYNDNTQVFAVGMSPTNRVYDLSSYVGGTINKIGLYCNSGVTTNLTLTPMILNNVTTDTDYVEHKEQTYIFPLGTQRMYLGDYLADDGIHHVRKQVVLDGTENWTYGNNNFSITGTNYKTYSNGGRCYSSHFIGSAIDDVINTDLHMWIGNATFIVCRYSSITSTNDFKTWLSTHNVTVEYELAEEEITPYTTEQQQAYNEIKQALSYEEQTNISGSSDESNPLFEVQYYKRKEV